MKRKHSFLSIFIAVLLVILVALVGFLGFGLYQTSQAINSISKDLTDNLSQEVSISDASNLARFYGSLFEEIQQYGNLEESEEAVASLMTDVFEKTAQNSIVQSVNFEDDKVVVQIQTNGVPMSELDEKFILSSVAKAALDYLSQDFLGAASSFFQGTEAMKRQLFSSYAPKLFEALQSELNNLPTQNVGYTVTMRIEDGKWVVETLEETDDGDVISLTPSQKNSSSSSSSNSSSKSSQSSSSSSSTSSSSSNSSSSSDDIESL